MSARKPAKTAADYMVIALSPALIMALVGSLCFFLLDVFYRGQMAGSVRWVLFWFVLAIVLVSRIGIEQSPEHAAVYGIALGLAVWFYFVHTTPSYLLSLVLLAVVWFSAHKLVWNCTLIDDDQDSSGMGLLQSPNPNLNPNLNPDPPLKRLRLRLRLGLGLGLGLGGEKKRQQPGRWVLWFSIAALPLFGLGQPLLPAGTGARQRGFAFVVIYMAAALGLLITTSFLGLRRYLRQRYLRMPGVIALAWLKFGAGIALLVIIGAIFLPRPGAKLVWKLAQKQVEYRLQQASQYAAKPNPPGQGQGQPGSQTTQQPAQGSTPTPSPVATPTPNPNAYRLLRTSLLTAAVVFVGWWLFRCRFLLLAMLRSVWAALADFWRRCLGIFEYRKPAREESRVPGPRWRSLAEFRNPFYGTGGNAWPPGEIILYTYDAMQAWAKEQGLEARREQTPREFLCGEMSERLPELSGQLRRLAILYAHAAYGEHLPAHCDLEPLKEIWRQLAGRAFE